MKNTSTLSEWNNDPDKNYYYNSVGKVYPSLSDRIFFSDIQCLHLRIVRKRNMSFHSLKYFKQLYLYQYF